jgi:hypothetical protein
MDVPDVPTTKTNQPLLRLHASANNSIRKQPLTEGAAVIACPWRGDRDWRSGGLGDGGTADTGGGGLQLDVETSGIKHRVVVGAGIHSDTSTGHVDISRGTEAWSVGEVVIHSVLLARVALDVEQVDVVGGGLETRNSENGH